MNESGLVYIDGQICSPAEAKISVFDHGMLYGDGVFEGIRVYRGKIFKLRSHLIRLFESARYIDVVCNFDLDSLSGLLRDLVKRTGLADAYIRLVITRGVGPLGVNPKQCPKSSTIVIVDRLAVYPAEKYDHGISLITSSVRQKNAASLSPRAKTLNYLPNMLAKLEAIRSKADEALLLNDAGEVTECVGENIFAVSHDSKGAVQIATPSTSCGILKGITRGVVVDLCKPLGFAVETKKLTLFELYSADEIFLTGTGAEIVPVVSIDGRPGGSGRAGDITKRLFTEFRRLTQEGPED